MKILITGHKGFIGSHLKGDGIDLKKGKDINEPIPGKYDVVINCAAELFNKEKMIYTNVLGTENIVRHCFKWGAKLIHFTTVSIYGSSYYGLTKKMAEDIINFLNPPDWVMIRLTNVYGPGGSSPANQFENGNKVIFGNGTNIKDHLLVDDVVKAVELAIKDNWTGEVNLSSGHPSTVNQVFKIFGKGEPEYRLDLKADLEVSNLDNMRARTLGWQPSWSIYDRS